MIVHGVLSLDVGGLERIVVELAKADAAAGQPVAVICLEKPGELAAGLEAHGVKVISLNKPPGRHPHVIDAAAVALRELHPTAIHTHQIGAAWFLAPAAKRLGVRVVHTEHGNPFARSPSPWHALKLRWLMRSAAKSIDAFAVVSPEIGKAVARWGTVPAWKIVAIPNGIREISPTISPEEMRDRLGVPRNAFVIGTVGRLDEVKRQDLLLRAAAELPSVWVVIVGDGPEKTPLGILAEKLGLLSRVHFAGYQPNPVDYLNAMDTFALTSRSEGFPVTLLEAWSQRKPVVVSAVGGLPSAVVNEKTGLLVHFGDVAGFSTAFRRLQSDAEFARLLGEAGQCEFRNHYSFDRMRQRYAALYTGSLQSPA